jgi:hypothetical protein
MGKSEFNSLVESFFENPLLGSIIEEALQSVESDDDPTPDETAKQQEQPAPGVDKLQQVALDVQQGHLDQNDLINMYKAGQLSKEEIQQVMEMAQGQEGQEGQEGGQPPAEQQPSEEELFAQQIEQTNDMFVKFAIYDKVAELSEKLNYFHDNFSDTESDMYLRAVQLKEFLNILSNLIFNLDTSVSYQMYGSILLQLTELFNEYLEERQKESASEEAEEASREAEEKSGWK